MADLEEVIEGLERCSHHDGTACLSCPYNKAECVDDLCADALELLKKHIWIPVSERLPTYAELKDDQVLVLFEDGSICSAGFDECCEPEVFGCWHEYFDPVSLGSLGSEWRPLGGVTHWMPLPELPKEDNDNA